MPSVETQYHRLTNPKLDSTQLSHEWHLFVKLVSERPLHPSFSLIIELLQRLTKNSSLNEIRILDHGCGGGFTLFYLAALGYHNIYGVDLDRYDFARLNVLASKVLNLSEPRFVKIENNTLPHPDEFFDLVISQTVVEHVQPKLLEGYYAEEGRVLKPGGIAYHDVPHSLNLYDKHTRVWLAQCLLPREIFLRFVKVVRPNKYEWAKEWLYLRRPNVHKSMVRKHVGPVTDLTSRRLASYNDLDFYKGEGFIKFLRKTIMVVSRIPIFGKVCLGAISPFVMLSTSTKKERLIKDKIET